MGSCHKVARKGGEEGGGNSCFQKARIFIGTPKGLPSPLPPPSYLPSSLSGGERKTSFSGKPGWKMNRQKNNESDVLGDVA